VTETSQKNIWIAYILAFLFGGAGLLYLGREQDKKLGIVLTIGAIVGLIGWILFVGGIIWLVAIIFGLYFTYKAAEELGLA
jgi:TM2 domain-containing membrane protein YozV